jgi:G:T-mismatch repair DNA endonuclease (very short patch repair protein)
LALVFDHISKDMQQTLKELLYVGDRLAPKRVTEKYLRKHGVYEDTITFGNFMESGYTLSETVKAILLGLTEAKTCLVCCSAIKPHMNYCDATCYSKTDLFKEGMKKRDLVSANVKRQQTMIDKYGVPFNSHRPEVKEIIANINRVKPEVQELLDSRDWMYEEYVAKKRTSVDIASDLRIHYSTVLDYCRKHGFTIRQYTNTSLGEKEVAAYLDELGVSYVPGDRRFKFELDLHVVDKKVAIEYNGLFWHSSSDRSRKDYHLNKTEVCEENGVQLLHIYSDEWEDPVKREIWKSIIRHKLGLTCNKVHARKCEVVEVTSSEARAFHEANHLHGFVGGQHIGLKYKDELVLLITHGKSRFEDGHELLRLTTKKYTSVPGGMSKILKHIGKDMVTYADRRYSSNNSYGNRFELIGKTAPNYGWVDHGGMVMLSRYKTQKHKLGDLLENFDASKSEFENMVDHGYRIIYDSGNYKFRIQTEET